MRRKPTTAAFESPTREKRAGAATGGGVVALPSSTKLATLARAATGVPARVQLARSGLYQTWYSFPGSLGHSTWKEVPPPWIMISGRSGPDGFPVSAINTAGRLALAARMLTVVCSPRKVNRPLNAPAFWGLNSTITLRISPGANTHSDFDRRRNPPWTSRVPMATSLPSLINSSELRALAPTGVSPKSIVLGLTITGQERGTALREARSSRIDGSSTRSVLYETSPHAVAPPIRVLKNNCVTLLPKVEIGY